jgi:hypothetical protein
MLKAGDIIVFNSKHGGWFSKAQRFFTRMPYTHTGVVIGDINGIPAVLEAKTLVVVSPWSTAQFDPSMSYWVFRPTLENFGLAPLMDLWTRYAGQEYGFGQLLWFVFRYVMESWPFRADVRRHRNWFPNGDICSELVFNWIGWLSLGSRKLEEIKNEWYENTCHAGDIFTICSRASDDFTLIEYRDV